MATEFEFGENGDVMEPSENWDDDFEFDPSSSSAATTAPSSPKTPRKQGAGSGRGRGLNSNAHSHYTRKMSIASTAGLSMVEDWDTDSVMGGGVGNGGFDIGNAVAEPDDNWDVGASTSTPGAGGSGSGAGTPRTPRTPKTPRTPLGKAEKGQQVPHSQHVEEEDTDNWDDYFEDGSPRKPGLTTSRLQPVSLLAPASTRRRRVSREGENEESWDDEYEDSADEDTANDFGFHDKEEDRTVTAKSRRAAFASSSSTRSPPLPPPPLPPPIPMSSSMTTSRMGPGPFHMPTSYYDNPQPFPAPRSPSSSVFSVPNTIYSQSNSHNSNGSTSHLRPSSAFALLPPSPEIHHMRQRGRGGGRAEVFSSSKMGGADAKDGKERRRLRKKSRPVPDGTFELKDVVSSLPSRPSRERERYSFSDAEGELNIHAVYPTSQGRDTPGSGVSPSAAASLSDLSSGHGHGQGRPHGRRSDGLPHPPEPDVLTPQTPRKQSTGPGAALLSRIGSVKKWGVRRRSRGVSAAPENRQGIVNSTDGYTQPTSPEEQHQDHAKSSRPQSSRSSNAHSHSHRNSVNVNPSTSGSPSPTNWFFRGGSSSKHAQADDRVSHGSPPVTLHRAGSMGGTSTRSRSRSRAGSRAGNARDGTSKVGSPLNNGSSSNLLDGKSPSSIVTTSTTGMSRKSMDSAGDVRFPAGEARMDDTSPSPFQRPMSTTATPDIYATPSKIVKRKSLGFVQLRRGLSTSRSQVSGYTSPEREGGKGKTKEEDSDVEGAGESSGRRYGLLGIGRVGRPGTKSTGEGGEESEERPRRKSFSRLLVDRGDKDKDKDKVTTGTKSVPMTPTKPDMPSSKDGSRGFMGSVRRISLVGRHRRMKSGGAPATNVSPPSSARSSSVSRPPMPTAPQSGHFQHQGRGNLPYSLPPLPGTGSNISLRLPSGSNADLPSMMRLISVNSSASGRSGEESLRPASTVSISASSRQVSATSVGGGLSDAEESTSKRYGDLRTARPRRSSRGSRSVSRTGEKERSSGEVTRKVSSSGHPKRTSVIGMDFTPLQSSSSFGSSSEDIPPLPRSTSRTSHDIQRPVTPPYSKPSSPCTPPSSALPPTTPPLPKTPTSNMKTPTPKNTKPPKSPKTPSRVPPLPVTHSDHPALPLLPPIELQPPSPPQTVKASSKTHGKGKTSLDAAFESLRFGLNAEQEREGRPSFGSLSVDDRDTMKGDGVSPATSTSSVFYTPKSSPKPGASPEKPKTSKAVGTVIASLSPGRGVGAGQSASLGRTSGIDVSPSRVGGVPGSGGGHGETETEKDKGATGWKRRNSLGDLKIPARISQAQVGLRRDLGMVREFAGSVEQLKDLQSTYYTLISEVQGVLDSYAQLHAQQAHEAARSSSPHPDPRKSPTTPPSPGPRSTSPSFLSSLNLRKGRSRSNTVGSTTSLTSALASASEPATQTSPPPPDVPFAIDEKKQAYKDLAAAFYSLNSRYKITLECAELLIDLGSSGTGGTASGGPSTSASSQAQVTSPTPLQLQPQHPGQRQDGDPILVTKRSRERAITLAGDESKPAVLVQASIPISTSVPSTSPLHNYTSPTTSPSSASQPTEALSHNSWRASAGRHDLSQRQLVLLREMLNNSNAANVAADEGLAIVEEGTPVQSPNPISPPPPIQVPTSASTYDSGPYTAPLPSSAPAPYGEGQMIVNWDWRWGDPRNSTITLPSPSEEAALHSKFAEAAIKDKEREREKEKEKEKKRRSTRLGMSGIRDMLRALKRSADAQTTAVTSPTSANTLPPPPMPVHYHSTTSLSTESSASAGRSQVAAATGKSSRPGSRARYPLPIPRMPSLSYTHSSGNSNPSGTTGRRRAKTSTGPESTRSREDVGWTANGTGPAFVPPKPSPRRPSLASIFRIGKSSEKAHQPQQQQQQQLTSPTTMSPEPLYSASTYESTGGTSQDNHSSSSHQNPNAEPYAPGELDGDLSNTSLDASDWDRMDSASDLDAAAKALSRSGAGPNKLSKFKHVKKGKSPYLFMRGGDDKKGNGSGKEGVSSSSSVFVAGQSQGDLVGRMGSQSHVGLVTKRSFCASQGSLHESVGGSTGGVPQRMTRLSGVEEMRDHEHEQTPAQVTAVDTHPPFSASSTRSSAHRRVSSGSRPSSARSTRSPIYSSGAQAQSHNLSLTQAQKTGSVRSMPPHLTASATMPPLGGGSSHQRPVSGPYPSSSSAHPYATASGHGRHGHHPHHHHHQAHAAATHGGDVNIRLAMTPENIKPLLENAREVLARLVECIEEVRGLSGRCQELVDDSGGPRGIGQHEAVVS